MELENKKTGKLAAVKKFTQDTTFHGLRYIGEDSHHKSRRVAWVLVVLGVSAVFIYAVVSRLNHLYSYPSNIKVTVGYWEQVPFPAVTICNENKYRLTDVHKAGLHDVLLDSYAKARSIEDFRDTGCEKFVHMDGVCLSQVDAKEVYNYHDISLNSCKHLCSVIHDDVCAGIFFQPSQQLCQVTSVSGSETKSSCPSSTLYLRRHRCLDYSIVLCDFEATSDLCSSISVKKDEEDTVRPAEEAIKSVIMDHTSLSHGNVLALHPFQQFRSLRLPFKSTTDMCLNFYHKMNTMSLNSLGQLEVEVQVVSENLRNVQSNIEGVRLDWTQLFQRLPDGINRVDITAVTRSTDIEIHLHVDDLAMRPCDHFSIGCRISKSGDEYTGSLNHSRTGTQCIPWASQQPLIDHMSNLTLHGHDSACRNPDLDPNGPWCFVDDDVKEYCDIPFCPCLPTQVRCGNGMCINMEKRCNGVDNCGDRTDEMECGSKTTLDCNFNNAFMCGYMSYGLNMNWEIIKSGGAPFGTGDDFCAYITKNAENLIPGEKVRLVSSIHVFENCTTVEFTAKIFTKSFDFTSELSVYAEGVEFTRQQLKVIKGNDWSGSWKTYSIDVPSGQLSLVFEVTSGHYKDWFVFIDNIYITNKLCSHSPQSLDTSISCNFGTSSMCGYKSKSTLDIFQWRRMPKHIVSSNFENVKESASVCGKNGTQSFLTSGFFQSPGFPLGYENNLNCELILQTDNETDISLSIQSLDIEANPYCDWDYFEVSRLVDDLFIPETKFCKSKRNLNLKGPVKLTFYSDHMGERDHEGIYVEYDIKDSQDTEYVLVAVHFGIDAPLREDTSALISPHVLFQQNQCVVLYLKRTLFKLDLKIVTDQAEWTILRLYPDEANFTDWEAYRVSIPSEFAGKLGQINFDATPVTETKTATYGIYLDSIQVIDENCLDTHQDDEPSLSCLFHGQDWLCSWTDGTESPVKWMPETIQGETMISFNMIRAAEDSLSVWTEGILISQKLNETQDTCLRLFMMVDVGLDLGSQSCLFVTQVIDNSEETLIALAFNSSMSWQDVYVTLPSGSYSIVLKVVGAKSVIKIKEIEWTNSTCSNVWSEDEFGATCRLPPSASNANFSFIYEDAEINLDGKPDNISDINLQALLASIDGNSHYDQLMSKVEPEEFILRCEWNGLPCNESDFEMSWTDLGYCFTFNRDSTNILQTSRTGAEYGLSLTLNVESYENIEEISTTSGVKVHLYPQGHVPLMKDLGYAVGPGTHTLFSLNYITNLFLEKPHGSCGSKALQYYPGVNYTVSHCWSDCAAKNMMDACHCTPIELGQNTTCTTEDYLTCILKYQYSSDAVTEECDCPAACNLTHPDIDISNSALTVRNIGFFLGDKENIIQQRYRSAQMNKTLIDAVDQGLQSVDEFKHSLSQYRGYHVTLQNRMKFIKDAVSKMANLKTNDMKSLFDGIDGRIEYYETKLQLERERIFATNELIDSFFTDVLSALYVNWAERSDETVIEKMAHIVEDCYKAVLVMKEQVVLYGSYGRFEGTSNFRALQNNTQFPSIAVIDEDDRELCGWQVLYYSYGSHVQHFRGHDKLRCLRDADAYRKCTISKSSPYGAFTGYPLRNEFYSDIVGKLKGWNELKGILNICINEYPNLLRQAKEFVKSMKEDLSDNLSTYKPPKFSAVWMHHETHDTLDKILEGFHVSSLVATEQSELKSAASLYFSDLTNDIKDVSNVMRSHYKQGLSIFGLLMQHYEGEPRAIFDNEYYNLGIWRQPELSSTNVHSYRLSEAQGEINKLAAGTSPEQLKDDLINAELILQRYFDDLIDRVESASNEFEKIGKNISLALATLQAKEESVRKSLVMDEDFVKSNFLQLDLYYPEKKFESLEQQASYGSLEFFSEFGGYLGLLLGASVITVCELLDMIIYSFMLTSLDVEKESRDDDDDDGDKDHNQIQMEPDRMDSMPSGFNEKPVYL